VDIVFGVCLDVVFEFDTRLGHFVVLAAWAIWMCRSLKVVNTLLKVAIEASTSAALSNTLWKLTLVGTLLAKGALLDNALGLVEVANAIRASHCTELATDALVFVDLNCAVLGDMACLGWANLYALWVVAMLALNRQEVHLDIWVCSAIIFRMWTNTKSLDPEVTNINTIDSLAGNGASKTTCAPVKVGDYCFISHLSNTSPILQSLLKNCRRSGDLEHLGYRR
jgi:hypothetical protein